jgi:drug/metabolite transporter (DMT)-like permease
MSGSNGEVGCKSVKQSSLGIALKLAATLAFSLMYVAIKLAGSVPLGEVIFFRGLFAIAPLLVVSFYTHGPGSLIRTTHPWLHLRRSIAGTTGMFLNFAALMRLPLADVTAFSFVAPIFATVLAALLLNEKVGPHRAAAVVIGFAGVMMMVEPHVVLNGFATGSPIGAVMALSASLFSAFVVVFIRQMSATETSEAIVFYFMVVCAAAGGVTMIWDFVPLNWMQTGWLVLCGILGGIGQVCMTYCYRYAEPSFLAPFDYAAMIWAVALGYFIFAEVPEIMVLVGAGVVIVSSLYIVSRERRLHHAHIVEASLL